MKHQSKMTLKLADALSVPTDIITQKLAWLGITGGGKTYAAGKLAELLLSAGAQVVVLDYVGCWWGLRLAADGKQSGIDIPIIGGQKGDVPIEPTAGALIADLVVDRHLSAVIDVSEFIPSELHKFGLAFAARLLQRRKQKPGAMHLILEECQEFIPQNATDKGDEPKMMRAFERLWKLGRNYGVGGSLVSQRPQEVNKKVLNMSSVIFAFNMIGKGERDAVRDWIKSNMSGAEDIVNTLPSLEIGDAHVFSPRFLKFNDVVHIEPKRTFDSSATPDFKDAQKEKQRKLTPIDLEKIKDAMAATIERAKAENPAELRQQIAQLERELRAARKEQERGAGRVETKIETKEKRVEVPILDAKLVEKLDRLTDRWFEMGEKLCDASRLVTQSLTTAKAYAEAIERQSGQPIVTMNSQRYHVEPTLTAKIQEGTGVRDFAAPLPARASAGVRANDRGELRTDNGKLPKIQQEILDGMCFLWVLGIKLPSRINVAVVIGKSSDGGYFNNNVSALNTAGFISYPRDGYLQLTEAGKAQASDAKAPRTLAELHQRWYSKLSKIERELLQTMIDWYPHDASRETLAQAIGKNADGGYFNNNVSALKSLGLFEYPAEGRVKATALLFPEGLS